ncbi:hypothetical protein M20_0944 [Lactococcus lactis subsp. lactis]|uniref:DUF4230 domain-containing protein n=2 Tax=Lactococcus lactis TaxID=1358 RepID=A0A0V8E6L1_LACLL|nr:hypothetical protein M20_0944 [Lactococcus lactis subsp. lactis]
MKTLGKAIANKIALVLVLCILIAIGWLAVKQMNPFNGSTKSEYDFVLTKFSKKNELVVSEATTKNTTDKVFTSKVLKNWPDWTKPLTSIFVGRSVTLEVPITTEFKLNLSDVTSEDVSIKNNVLTFKKPLIVKVDSQQTGNSKISNASNGIIDKAVDLWTSGSKAQEFLSEQSQDSIYETSNFVMRDKGRQKKVAKYASEDLESLLNLNSDKHIKVKLSSDNLKFVNIDSK